MNTEISWRKNRTKVVMTLLTEDVDDENKRDGGDGCGEEFGGKNCEGG
jgi:hypothetical protein